MSKLNNLKLAPEQQSAVDSGISFHQWALGRTQSQQLFNNLKRRLISSLASSQQASTLLFANRDQIGRHCLTIEQALANKAKGAFLPVRERDLYNLDPQPTLHRELDPDYCKSCEDTLREKRFILLNSSN